MILFSWIDIAYIFIFNSIVVYSKAYSHADDSDPTHLNLHSGAVNNENSDKDILSVHIVPHTHDDVGWLKTVEQYYYGQNNTIRQACVSCILDNIMHALQLNPSRKFTYVEMAFFTMWWEEQSADMKSIVRNLVKNGQLSFANGGWCMHDEATTHFMGMMDQTTLGHDFLKREFDYVPSVGWQLDPFGHSATQASLLTSEVGFNALYFGRIDYQDLQQRHSQRNCEGIWDASQNLPGNSVFWGLTGSYSGNYGAPEGFCFDILCDEDGLYGMEEDAMKFRLEDFLKQLKVQSDRTRGRNIMLTMGSDFQYENAHFNFKSLDLLIDTINTKMGSTISAIFPDFDGVKLFYSTPELYTQYKYKEYMTMQNQQHGLGRNNIEPAEGKMTHLQIKTDDFFPYSDCDHCFWTGYFTSRPALKRLERVGSSLLQAARQMQALFRISNNLNYGEKAIDALEKGVAIAQHHDGVSGTSKQHVAYDYAKKIHTGIDLAGKFMASLFEARLKEEDINDIMLCQMRNESRCDVSQRQSMSKDTEFYVIIYNALGWDRHEIVSIPVNTDANYTVEEQLDIRTWKERPSALVQNFNYARIIDASPYNLMIDVGIGALSAKLYRIKTVSKEHKDQDTNHHVHLTKGKMSRGLRSAKALDDGKFVVQNGNMKIHFSSGVMTKFVNAGVEIEAVTNWGYYTSFDSGDQNSGAYIFRPMDPNQQLTRLAPIPSTAKIIENDLITEVHITFEGNWIHQISRIYQGKPFVDIEYTVGPIPIDDGVGKEVVNSFRTSIANNGTFFTDSNGREFLERKRSERTSWDFVEFEPIAGNYYPINAAIFIEDNTASLAVLTDRTQGGSSLKDGNIELMVHRRILEDDARGVDESLNETSGGINAYPPYGDASRRGDGLIVTGTHRVLLSDGHAGAMAARDEMDGMFSPPLVFAGASNRGKNHSLQSHLHPLPSFIGDSLPRNVQLLTVKLLSAGVGQSTILIRLGHSYGKGESSELSKEVRVDLSKLFPGLLMVTEKTLTGNQDKSLWIKNKMKWTKKGSVAYDDEKDVPGTVVVLRPMEIRTFEILVASKDSMMQTRT